MTSCAVISAVDKIRTGMVNYYITMIILSIIFIPLIAILSIILDGTKKQSGEKDNSKDAKK
jgi:hypothetical protein